MYIKHNSMAKTVVVFSIFNAYAFEIVTDLNVGMQTNNRQLSMDLTQSGQTVAVLRQQASSSLGYSAAEYANLEVGADFNIEDDFYIMPKMGLRFMNKRFDMGVKAAYGSRIYNDNIRFSTFVDIYHSWFYDGLQVSDYFPLEVDYGIQLDVGMNDFMDMRLVFTQPAVFGHSVKYGEHDFDVENRNNVAIGVSWHLLAEYNDLPDEYLQIIQEPISIPRIDLVEPPSKLSESAQEAPIELPEDIEQVDEPLGWFAWILEFLASLFRF